MMDLGMGDASASVARGRPKLANSRKLSNDLMAAIECGLRQKSHLDLTTREIASAAGTYPGMIHYYYQSKNGLLDAALDNMSTHITEMLCELNRLFTNDCHDATRKIMQAWVDMLLQHRGTASVVLIESFRPDSPVWCFYREKKSRGSFGRMQEVIRTLIRRGYYRPDVDPGVAAFSILSIVHSPVIIGQIMTQMGHNVADMLDGWFEDTVSMIDRQYRLV